MPNKCCVPGCTGNYSECESVQVFRFPKDEERKRKWISYIPRSSYVPTNHSVVCQRHFTAGDIIMESSCVDSKTGEVLTVPLKKPRLKTDAVPSIFPNCPSYLSKQTTSREPPAEKRARIEAAALRAAVKQSEDTAELHKNKYSFNNFEELLERLKLLTMNDKWCTFVKSTSVTFLYLDLEKTPHDVLYFVIHKDLKVEVFMKGVALQIKEIASNVHSVHSIEQIMTLLQNVIQSKENIVDLNTIISGLIGKLKCKENKSKVLDFVKLQLKLCTVSKELHRFDPHTMIVSSLLYLISSHAYRYLRSTGYVILPHPNTIKNILLSSSIDSKLDDFLRYLRQKVKLLNPNDLPVSLMIDEIYVKPYFDYKGGNIVGMANDNTNAATTAHVFMIQSIMSPYKDVVHILPVNKIDANALFSFIKKIVLGLEQLNFQVIAIVADNNKINRKSITQFAAPPQESIVYPHPCDQSRPLFFLHDSVHILKSIRNNWINLKNEGSTFCFPDFEDHNVTHYASFSALRELFVIEKNKLCRFGYGLSIKALWPSSFERQNVKLVLQIFNECIANSLLELGPVSHIPNYEGTGKFISIITTWWSVTNVKTPFKGDRLRNEMQKPLTNHPDDARFKFLKKFVIWLDQWKSLDLNGKLTKETHTALNLTTYALIELTNYCINERKMKYLLSGKFQTDVLEARFGSYRQLAGSQYNISVRQIFEAENKLRLQSVLELNLSPNLPIRKLKISELNDDLGNPMETGTVESHFYVTVSSDDVNNVNTDLPVITYIAGYCCYCALKKFKCDDCRDFLIIDRELVSDFEYRLIDKLDRGKLCFPRKKALLVVIFCVVIVEKLLENQDFLQLQNQRRVAFDVVSEQIHSNDEFSIVNSCSLHTVKQLWEKIVWTAINILLNNYCKLKNNSIQSKALNKRKLCTVSQT